MADYLYSFDEKLNPTSSNKHFYLHNHNEYEIYMFLEGDAKYVVEDRNYDLVHGDIIIIRKHEMHRVFHNSDKKYRRIIIMISPDFFTEHKCPEYEAVFLDKGPNVGNKIGADTVRSSGLYDTIMRLKKYSDGFSRPNTAISDSIMIEMLHIINGITNFETDKASHSTIKNVINYINQNFTEEITLDILCKQFFVSKYHLCRIFKDATGLTVQNYIKQKRITLALELTKNGASLTEAALEAGFKNYSSFYRACLDRYNISPKNWRYEH